MKSANNGGKGSQLIKNTLVLGMGKLSTQLITFLLLPLYTTYLCTEEYGIVDLVATYVMLLVPVITIQTEMYLFRFLIDNRQNILMKKKIITNSFYIVFVLMMITFAISIFIYLVISIKYYYYIIFVLLANIFSSILLQTARGLGDNIGYSISCIIISLTNIIINIVLLTFYNMGIVGVFIATIMSNLVGGIYLYARNHIYKCISFSLLDKNIQQEIVKYSLPLVPNGLLWWVINASDRTIISLIMGMASNGIYSVSNRFSNIIIGLYSIFNMSWTETVSIYIEDDEDGFISKTFNNILNFICCFCLILINSMFIIFPILIKDTYAEAYFYIPILIISSIFNMLSSNLSAIYVARKQTKKIAMSTIFSAIVNLGINVILIYSIGLYAAAFSTLLSFLCLFIFRYFDVNRDKKIIYVNPNKIIFFSTIIILSTIVYFYDRIILNIFFLLGSFGVFFIINYSQLEVLLKNIRNIKKRSV